MHSTIILDTNFLMIPSQFKVDIFSEIERICPFEHELAVLRETLEELENIMEKQKGRDRAAAKLAIKMVSEKGLAVIGDRGKTKTLKNADQLIVELARSHGTIVATQDKALRARLRELKVPMIVLRQKSHLEFIA